MVTASVRLVMMLMVHTMLHHASNFQRGAAQTGKLPPGMELDNNDDPFSDDEDDNIVAVSSVKLPFTVGTLQGTQSHTSLPQRKCLNWQTMMAC